MLVPVEDLVGKKLGDYHLTHKLIGQGERADAYSVNGKVVSRGK
ncbi:hypothetical protein [Dictyobacter kobayashii]|nr:hypothetical protein [Dictyobacter kobayashii]